MRISWTERKPNQELIEMAASLLKTTRNRQLQVFGHINIADGIEKQNEWKDLWYQKHKIHRQSENFVTRKESPNSEPIGKTDD